MSKLHKAKNLLRKMGCHSKGIPFRLGKVVTQTMSLSSALHNSEIWQCGMRCERIHVALNALYCSLIDVPSSVNTCALYNEMGLILHEFRAQGAALGFRNHVMGLPEHKLVKRLYNALKGEPAVALPGSYGANFARDFFEPVAKKAKWDTMVGKGSAKKKIHDFIALEQSKWFVKCKESSESVRVLSRWSSSDRTAPYLLQFPFRSWFMKEGRRFKSLLRLSCHGLNCLHGRCGSSARLKSCCPGKECQSVEESVEHVLCSCPAYSDARESAFHAIESIVHGFSGYSPSGKVSFLLKDETPCDHLVYRFFSEITQIRAKLVEPTRPGPAEAI